MLPIFYFLLVVLLSYCENAETGDKDSKFTSQNTGENPFPEFKKIATFAFPFIKEVKNDKCRRQLQTYVQSLENSSLWAVQMFDASAKIPQGLLTADAFDFGNYDSCLEINLGRRREDNILGKYCLATFSNLTKNKIFLSNRRKEFDVFGEDLENMSWNSAMVPLLRYGFKNDVFRSGICVPHECSSDDVESLFRYLYTKVLIEGLHIDVTVSPNSCYLKNGKDTYLASLAHKIIWSLFTLVVFETILDIWSQSAPFKLSVINFINRTLWPFSSYRNYKMLPSVNSMGHLPVVDFVKVYATVLLTVTRRLSFLLEGPILNRDFVAQVFDEFSTKYFFELINNLIASTFLVISGFLCFNKVNRVFQKKIDLKIILIYLFLFLRMAPLQIFAIFFYSQAFENLGDGPLWKERTLNSVGNCQNSWLPNLIYINNFIEPQKICIYKSWLFSVIAQCFLAVPVIIAVTKSSTARLAILGLLTTTFFLLSLRNFNQFTKLKTVNNNYSNSTWYQRLNIETTHQSLPFFIGVGSAMLYGLIKEKKIRISKVGERIFTFLTAICLVGIFLSPLIFLAAKRKRIPVAVSSKLVQILWSISISVIVVGGSTHNLCGLGSLLKHKYFTFFSSFTYPYLLILEFVQLYTVGTVRTIDYFSFLRLIWMSAADLALTYFFAFCFYMMMHKPFVEILKTYIKQFKQIQSVGERPKTKLEHSKKIKIN